MKSQKLMIYFPKFLLISGHSFAISPLSHFIDYLKWVKRGPKTESKRIPFFIIYGNNFWIINYRKIDTLKNEEKLIWILIPIFLMSLFILVCGGKRWPNHNSASCFRINSFLFIQTFFSFMCPIHLVEKIS